VTTQHTDYEQNDVDATVVEHPFSPDTAVPSTATEMLTPTEEEAPTILPSSADSTDTQSERQDEVPVAQAEHGTRVDMTEVRTPEEDMTETSIVETHPGEVDMVSMGVTDSHLTEMSTAGGDAQESEVVQTKSTETDMAGEDVMEEQDPFSFRSSFSLMEEVPLEVAPGGSRSFADYIEEFRQNEARYSASLQGSQETLSLLTPFTSDVDTLYQAPAQSDTPIASTAEIGEVPPTEAPFVEETVEMTAASANPDEEQVTVASTPMQATAETTETQTPTLPTAAQPVAPSPSQSEAERPVSPLLRPATRLRIPRHGTMRQREEDLTPATSPVPPVVPEVSPAMQAEAVPTETVTEQAKPTRRYRFDRPSATPSSPQRVEENREKDLLNRSGPTTSVRLENGQSGSGSVTETQPKQTTNDNASTLEQQPAKLQEPISAEPAEMERRRKSGQDRHQEQSVSTLPTSPTGQTIPMPPVAPQPEVAASMSVPTTPQAEEIAPEDLPPLEYSELQKANSRRRRRHRAGTNNGSPAAPSIAKPTPPESSAPSTPPAVTPAGGTSPTPATPTTPATPAPASNNAAAQAQQYNLVSGYTLNQMNQGNDQTGPFMGPEPSPARGSVSTRDGRNVRAEAQRSPVYPVRSPDVIPSTTSIHQLGSILSQAIQTQTDRMVTELRRANQAASNISVTLPPFPSTERVGVFVDVANLLYSARTLRISVNFGKLLDFLRGNRRLVRAHAYCPTSPQPGEDQMFLQAVKGLGYRITTKHYKTFASGARKADLDLDLCMDVVRLVEGRAIDCVVLVSGDSDFMPMLDYCSDHGVRVEVAAFDEAMSATLRQSCDLFINLSMLEEIRA
jgi:uncharacterized LabA/DUF88 family protein